MTEEEYKAIRADWDEHSSILGGTYTIPVTTVKSLMAHYGERCVEQMPFLFDEIEQRRRAVTHQFERAEAAERRIALYKRQLTELAHEVITAFESEVPLGNPTIEKAKTMLNLLEEEAPENQ